MGMTSNLDSWRINLKIYNKLNLIWQKIIFSITNQININETIPKCISKSYTSQFFHSWTLVPTVSTTMSDNCCPRVHSNPATLATWPFQELFQVCMAFPPSGTPRQPHGEFAHFLQAFAHMSPSTICLLPPGTLDIPTHIAFSVFHSIYDFLTDLVIYLFIMCTFGPSALARITS